MNRRKVSHVKALELGDNPIDYGVYDILRKSVMNKPEKNSSIHLIKKL